MLRLPPVRPGRLLLLGLFVCCTSGCLTQPSDDAAPEPSGDPAGAPQGMSDVPEALFILQATDIWGPDWPQRFSRYSFLVCNPSITAADVRRIRIGLPGVVALAYVNLQDLAFDQYPDNPYWQAFAAVFDTSLCVRDLPTHRVVRVQGYNGPGTGLMHAIPHTRNVDILVAFHRYVTMGAGWDGLYLDQSHQEYPWWRKPIVQAQSSNFDVDADGITDTLDQLSTKYVAGRVLLTSRLRQALGSSVYLVANSGGALTDPNLNGITIEGVGKKWTVAQAKAFLLAERAIARTPFLAAGWVIAPECVQPTLQLAHQVPGTCYGRVPTLVP